MACICCPEDCWSECLGQGIGWSQRGGIVCSRSLIASKYLIVKTDSLLWFFKYSMDVNDGIVRTTSLCCGGVRNLAE